MASIFNGRIEVQKQGAGSAALYGYSRNGGVTKHKGIDVTCPDQPTNNTIVYAVEGGKVLQSRIVNNGIGSGTAEWGNYVTIVGNKTGTYQTYAHLASRAVAAGQTIKEGAEVGVMGNTGNAKNGYKHVHFEVRRTSSGNDVNPAPYLGIQNAVGIYGGAPGASGGGSSTAKYFSDSGYVGVFGIAQAFANIADAICSADTMRRKGEPAAVSNYTSGDGKTRVWLRRMRREANGSTVQAIVSDILSKGDLKSDEVLVYTAPGSKGNVVRTLATTEHGSEKLMRELAAKNTDSYALFSPNAGGRKNSDWYYAKKILAANTIENADSFKVAASRYLVSGTDAFVV